MNKNKEKFKILVEGENYRVTTITKVIGLEQSEQDISIRVDNLDISEGLNIEEKTKNNSYIVINTIR